MCGIAGSFGLTDRALEEAFAESAMIRLAHRGPDDHGTFRGSGGSLIHRRLSILDTSAAGHQPMARRDGRYLLIHNGEIYNYLELRELLRGLGHTFRTETDTEVILAAFEEWGTGCFARFNGIWAMAILDTSERRLVLSRDRLGVKPLYHATVAGGTIFASEIKALLDALPRREPNLSAVRDYAWDGLVDHSSETFYRGVAALSAGTCMIVSETARRVERYWELPRGSGDADPRGTPSDGRTIEEFRGILESSIRLQLRADVPLGSCLSGGLDSSTIVILSSRLLAAGTEAHETMPRLALTASFPGDPNDESDAAGLAARAAGVAHELVESRPLGVVQSLSEVLREQDEPFVSASIMAQREVMRAASNRGIKVMLDGQGADELLGGYPDFRHAWLLGLLTHHPIAAVVGLRAMRREGIGPLVGLRKAALAGLDLRCLRRLPLGRATRPPGWLGHDACGAIPLPFGDAHAAKGATTLNRQLRLAIDSTSLPALLRYEDRNSMRFGVEARVPFLDHRLVEAALALPDRLKIRDGVTKWALRAATRGIVPEAIRTDRRKIGFIAPQAAWLGEAKREIEALLGTSTAAQDGLLNRSGIEVLLQMARADHWGTEHWRCLSIELWYRQLRGS
jgi:asparagine synthase (glutamine-hydrolysing)